MKILLIQTVNFSIEKINVTVTFIINLKEPMPNTEPDTATNLVLNLLLTFLAKKNVS